jgi:hypothetical protein
MSEENKAVEEIVEEVAEDEAVVEETAEEIVEPIEIVDETSVDELEAEALRELDEMREDSDDQQAEKEVENAKEKIKSVLEDFRSWINNNANADNVRARKDKVKEDIENIINTTKEKISEIGENEKVRSTLNAGKDFIDGAVGLVSDGIKAGSDILMKNDNVRDLVDKGSEQIEKIRESDTFKKSVDVAEDAISKMNEFINTGINKIKNKDNGESE